MGPLLVEKQRVPRLLHSEVLEGTNQHTVALLFNHALQILWPEGIEFMKVYIMLSDSAAYMMAIIRILYVVYILHESFVFDFTQFQIVKFIKNNTKQ